MGSTFTGFSKHVHQNDTQGLVKTYSDVFGIIKLAFEDVQTRVIRNNSLCRHNSETQSCVVCLRREVIKYPATYWNCSEKATEETEV